MKEQHTEYRTRWHTPSAATRASPMAVALYLAGAGMEVVATDRNALDTGRLRQQAVQAGLARGLARGAACLLDEMSVRWGVACPPCAPHDAGS